MTIVTQYYFNVIIKATLNILIVLKIIVKIEV
jgi:hypothetical protein